MLKETYGLTDEGVRNVKRGALWTAAADLAVFLCVWILLALLGSFLDHLVAGKPLPDALPYLLADAGALALLFATQYMAYYYQYGVIYRESGAQRLKLAEQLRRLPLSFFGKRDLADLTETLMHDVATIEHAYSHVLPELYGANITVGVAAVLMLAYDWRLGAAALWSCPAALLMMHAAKRRFLSASRSQRAYDLKVTETLQETLGCVREIRATNQCGRYLAKLGAAIDAAEAAAAREELVIGLSVNGAQIVLRLSLATTFAVGAALLVGGSMDLLVFLGYLLGVSRLYAPFDQCFQMMAELYHARIASERMQSFYEEPIAEGTDAFRPQSHEVVFDEVCFGYGKGRDAQVLDHVSFTAHEGEVTALVGPSGSGKSTCARLACRFWDADSGRVSVGGVDVSHIAPETLLGHFSIVFQDVTLFDGTVLENIRLGRRGATDEEALAAAHAAFCDGFVEKLPQGYGTPIGENGARLSGGERQRISIARALLKDAPIVLLDEATASLDVESETEVHKALSQLLAEKTVLVIAHRMRTVEQADQIVVLEDGHVAEHGSPQELLQKGGAFAHMVELQQRSAAWRF